jgi:prepilin-type N-terminal cleavage/methylation domain-containing protein
MFEKNISNAFTLLELLIVMGVIATLATVLMVIINPAESTRRTNDARRFSDMQMIKTAIDLTASDGKTIPNTGSGYIVLDSNTSLSDIDPSGTNVFDVSKYLSYMPEDPSYKISGITKGLVMSGGNCVMGELNSLDMQYRLWGNGTQYIIRAHMQSATNCDDVTKDGNNNSTLEMGTEPGLDAF